MFSVCLKVFCSLFPSVCARCFVYGCTPDMHTHARTYTHTLAGLRSSLGTAPLPSSSQLILASCHVLSTSPLHPTHPPPPHFHLCFQTCFFFCVCECVLLNQDHSDSSSKHLLRSSSRTRVLIVLSFSCCCTKSLFFH